MSQTIERLNGTGTPEVKRGFAGLGCILCGQTDGVGLDLDDCSTFRCRECNDEFTAEDVQEHLAAWTQVLAWANQAPARRAE